MERLEVLAPVDRRNGREGRAAGADFFPEGIDRMETAWSCNDAKSDQMGSITDVLAGHLRLGRFGDLPAAPRSVPFPIRNRCQWPTG
jgi:hypothetical protein